MWYRSEEGFLESLHSLPVASWAADPHPVGMASDCHHLYSCLVAPKGAMSRRVTLLPAPTPGRGQAWPRVICEDPGSSPSKICVPHRLSHFIPELRERGDPERSPGCAEGHLYHTGEGRPPHPHCGALQGHGAGHHADRRTEEVRTFPYLAQGCGAGQSRSMTEPQELVTCWWLQ